MYLILEVACPGAPIQVPEDPPGRSHVNTDGAGLRLVSGGAKSAACAEEGPEKPLSPHLYPRILRRAS